MAANDKPQDKQQQEKQQATVDHQYEPSLKRVFISMAIAVGVTALLYYIARMFLNF